MNLATATAVVVAKDRIVAKQCQHNNYNNYNPDPGNVVVVITTVVHVFPPYQQPSQQSSLPHLPHQNKSKNKIINHNTVSLPNESKIAIMISTPFFSIAVYEKNMKCVL